MKPIQSIVFLGVIQVQVHFVLAMTLVLTLNRAETMTIVSAILGYMNIEAIGVFDDVFRPTLHPRCGYHAMPTTYKFTCGGTVHTVGIATQFFLASDTEDDSVGSTDELSD
ncbi:unnamed protein product [Diabrotica balteata]|uniref:Uncharacterized protein n=1 Tax=Diabrotica balteata TaxID=107213 RepID=A0A9P0GZ00_DIABA|nr:unnamed protein product [Diabrotica balteata]